MKVSIWKLISSGIIVCNSNARHLKPSHEYILTVSNDRILYVVIDANDVVFLNTDWECYEFHGYVGIEVFKKVHACQFGD